MKPSIAILSVGTFLLITTAVFGTGPAVQHQFKGGDPASATQVNENFQELADRIQEIRDDLAVAVYDYHVFLTPANISSKKFTFTNLSGTSNQNCNSTEEIRQYESTPQGDNSVITVTYIYTDTNINQNCGFYAAQYLSKPNALVYQSYIQYDEADTSTKTLVSERIYNDELPVLTSSMKKGMTWGSASSTTTTDYNLDPPIINEPGRHVIWQYTLLDVEDVTVPYDNGRADSNPTTYTGCLKISRNRFEVAPIVSMEWYCPNMGLVKRVSASVTALLTEVN